MTKAEQFEVDEGWARCQRLIYLHARLEQINISLFRFKQDIKKAEADKNYEWKIFASDCYVRHTEDAIRIQKEIDRIYDGINKPMKEGMINDEMIETARSTGIDHVYQYETDKAGFMLCPFHSEKTPSMKISGTFYYCFGCGEKGDTISFVMKKEGFRFIEAVRFILHQRGDL